ncbi:S1 family peptidase [Aspergillus glaucus CBS 516.65]|uniref:Peptidase S1 domain-containing protein n=1 Tax=Aspergillus glaucus CBS 516.65 TaxID=1160497 RepID=A0A1L9VC32_ASPGL|nr:hypothetical protein ASPGLDRAFT_50533 [Aspergillus glaucus CBS 516.65]OJJ81474.1 hypothetical protein ASPGLDRAFT_50533 [Aspergillus glaucus CBS 516.65]
MAWSQLFLLAITALSFFNPVFAIYQGTHSNCGEHPYAVHIEHHSYDDNGASYSCGGTIITPRHILTASHCVLHAFGASAAKAQERNMRVHLLRCENNRLVKTGRLYPTKEIHLREEYLTQPTPEYDIAVIELEQEIKYHPFLSSSAFLPTYEGPVQSRWEDNKQLTLIGSGTISSSPADLSDHLRQVRAAVIDKSECGHRSDAAWGYPGSMSQMQTDKFFCAIDRVTLGGACSGDSGSGSHEYTNRKKKVVGVVAAGPVYCSQPNHYNAYTSASAYLGWIKSVVTPYQLKQF